MVALANSAALISGASFAHEVDDLERRAHHTLIRTSTAQAATAMQELLGQQMVAAITGISDVKTVGRWARGEREPRIDTERRLRDAFHIATLLTLADSPATARAWFTGMNPQFRDRAPFAVLSEEPDSAPRVLAAARAFVANG